MAAANPPCVEGDGPGMVGLGDPPVWLCLAHFEERMAGIGATVRRLRAALSGGQEGPEQVPSAAPSGSAPSDRQSQGTPDPFVDLAAVPRAHQPHEAHPVHPHLGGDAVPGPAGLMGSHQQGPTLG